MLMLFDTQKYRGKSHQHRLNFTQITLHTPFTLWNITNTPCQITSPNFIKRSTLKLLKCPPFCFPPSPIANCGLTNWLPLSSLPQPSLLSLIFCLFSSYSSLFSQLQFWPKTKPEISNTNRGNQHNNEQHTIGANLSLKIADGEVWVWMVVMKMG